MELVAEPAAYQVFINYGGPDTECTLATLIYRTLKSHGLRVFLGKEELEEGEVIVPAIWGAISSASVHIALFSERYAESNYSLDELCWILRSFHERTIIPIYWNVEPVNLRYIEKGCYAEAFERHQQRGRVTQVLDRWKAALREASEISGFILKTDQFESDHKRFLEDIVKIVLNVVRRETFQPGTYQVFINHRGPDAKLTHASLIYHRLKHCGLRVFLDDEELLKGDSLAPAIEGAIRSSSVHVVIFSEKYAESRWCLNELCWILNSFHEGKATIVPLFYQVEPTDLRDLKKEPYGDAFQKHQREGRDTTEWEKALKEAAGISGFIVKTNQSNYGIYLEQLVRAVFTEVKRREPLEVATHPVGLDEAAKDFQIKIGYQRESKETKIVGIAGMGGIGKSTLAKHFYNVKRFDFTRFSFLFNVKGQNLPSLQKKLIHDLLMDYDLHIDNTIEGKGILQRSLTGLKALIVLDDVDDVEQIDSLLDMDAVGCGTLILLTSRDRDLLRRSSPKALLYDVKPLHRQHGQELFCRHAFLLPKPVPGFEDLVREFLRICGGLPCSLKVLGRHLAGNDDKAYWKLQAEKFSKRLPDDIINTLKVSYEALSKEKKEMLLDIGCFLGGESRELTVRVLEGLGYSDVRDCLESLHQKCLVEFNYDVESDNDINYKYELSRVMMHNQVEGLTRHIAREEFFEFARQKPFRLSCSSDIEEMFQLQDGSESVLTRGIRIPKGQNPPQLANDINIRGVRLLVVEHPMDLSSFAMSGNLAWLRLNNFPSISIPSTISLSRLRVLELHDPGDHVKQLIDIFDELLCELDKLKINASGAASGSAWTKRKPLEIEHYMNSCRSIFSTQQGAMTSFSGFPQAFPLDFGKLKNLTYLDLSGCANLTELPNSFSQLLHLQYLSLQYCVNLFIPSDILGEISTLEYVDFKGCAKLVHLPEGMKYQTALVYMNLEFCFQLKTLTYLSNLEHLKYLNINGCIKLEALNLEGLRSLEKLSMEFCFELKTLTNLSDLSNLKFLNMNGCVKLETLNLEGLRSLEYLNLEFCSEIKTFTNLENLKLLNINGCVKLETLNLEGLRSLEQIKADACWRLKGIEASSQQKRLHCLWISTHNGVICFVKQETYNIEYLRSLLDPIGEACRKLKSIVEVDQEGEACHKLKSIVEVDQREQLKCLQISTHCGGIWNDAFQFFISPSYMSAVFFVGKANVHMDIGCILDNLDSITVLDVPATSTVKSPVLVENANSHTSRFMCFITSSPNGGFRIKYEGRQSPEPYKVHDTYHPRGSGGRMLHIFMITRNLSLLKDENLVIYHFTDGRGNQLDAEEADKGWIVTGTDSQVFQVWNRVVFAFAQ